MTPIRLSVGFLRVLALLGLLAGLFSPVLAAAQPLPAPAVSVASPLEQAVLSAPAPSALPAPALAVTCTTTYTVKSGDYLTSIAAAHGTKWRDIADLNSLANPNLIYPGQLLCLPAVSTTPVTTPVTATVVAPAGVPTLQIVSVVADQSVTLKAEGFPANQKIDVRMGKNGTLGAGGALVTTIDSGSGAFTGTYTIPAELKGQGVIAIRLDCRWGGYFSYNWFYNNSTK